jgi:hypothetical protein
MTLKTYVRMFLFIYNVPGGKVSILGGHSIGHSTQEFHLVKISTSFELCS